MSEQFDSFDQGEVTANGHRRVAPPVIRVADDDVQDVSMGPIEGSLVLLHGSADSEVIEEFDRSVRTGDGAAFRQLMEDELEAYTDAEDAPQTADDAATADLTYHERTVVDDLAVDDDSFGVAVAPYQGGELDEDAFSVEQDVDDAADVQYRLVVVPPTLDEGEQDANQMIPTETDGDSIRVDTDSNLCVGVFAAAAFGFAVGTAVAAGGDANLSRDSLAEASLEETEETTVSASVDELIEAQS
ncbi:hypothetical protein [Halorubellus litoreus]|uniref:Uncharacterized protein n=1 Tax=Halorubellus litoreus TaxID=755308 RepID=A0ABD5V8I1_9EURY